jgi:two-component system chemotaxis sensor kinase CheA
MDIAALQLQMRDAFRVEAGDLLAELDSSMLELESRPQDADLLNRVFRAIHTIKGSGATAGFDQMAAFTHHVEELFDEARLGRLTITPAIIDLALQAKDLIGQLLESNGSTALEPACAEVVEALAKFLPHKVASASSEREKSGARTDQKQRYKIFFKPHPQVFSSGTDPINLVDELRALGEATVTARVDGVPSLESLEPEQCYLGWDVELLSAHPIAKLKEVFLFVEDESEIRIERLPVAVLRETAEAIPLAAFLNIAGQSLEALDGFLSQLRGAVEPDPGCCKNYLRILKTFQAAATRQAQEEPAALLAEQIHLLETAGTNGATMADETKVSLEEGYQKLAALIQSLRTKNQRDGKAETLGTPKIDVVSPSALPAADAPKKEEAHARATIRVDQEKLDRLMRSAGELLVARNAFPLLAKRIALEHGLSVMGKEIKDAGDQISHIAEDLQAAILSIRMMPIRTVFQRFPRMVRDICRAQNKEAELLLEGEDTELDKTVIEQIADPLVHLVRNAVDHGIELPDVREQAGKPRAGKVTLKAYNKATNVVIEIQDDGHGMDTARLKKKALEKGLISAAAAEAMDDRAALELIFLPGLSTAEKVTDISGRGVGMDVVRSNIFKLHGTTTLESHPGGGSRVTITLPASLMVSKGVLVDSGGEEYVFPIESVVQTVNLPRGQIHRHEQASFATFRNEVYPLLQLADHFASEKKFGEIAWPEEVPMAIVQTNRGKVGVAVDRFLGQVEVIVKPLGRDFAAIPAFQGATILGDGRIALVINPAGFV